MLKEKRRNSISNLKKNGFTASEIRSELGYSSVSTVYYHLNQLTNKLPKKCPFCKHKLLLTNNKFECVYCCSTITPSRHVKINFPRDQCDIRFCPPPIEPTDGNNGGSRLEQSIRTGCRASKSLHQIQPQGVVPGSHGGNDDIGRAAGSYTEICPDGNEKGKQAETGCTERKGMSLITVYNIISILNRHARI